jgi:hypothetical protein
MEKKKHLEASNAVMHPHPHPHLPWSVVNVRAHGFSLEDLPLQILVCGVLNIFRDEAPVENVGNAWRFSPSPVAQRRSVST